MLALSFPVKVNFPSAPLSAALLMPETIAQSLGQHLSRGRVAVLRNMMQALHGSPSILVQWGGVLDHQ